jgi:hypothetical protein
LEANALEQMVVWMTPVLLQRLVRRVRKYVSGSQFPFLQGFRSRIEFIDGEGRFETLGRQERRVIMRNYIASILYDAILSKECRRLISDHAVA